MVDALLWLGGWWRATAAPLAVSVCLAVLLANTASPGACQQFVRRWCGAAARWMLALAGLAVACAVLEILRDRLTLAGASLGMALFVVQVALYQRLLTVIAAVALTAAVLRLDWKGERAVARLSEAVSRRIASLQPTLTGAAVIAALALFVGSFASAVWPESMRGWGRADPPDAQRFSYYTSFVYRGVPLDAATVERTGFEAGYHGLTLPPGELGTLVLRLERDPGTTILLRPNFYDRDVTEDGKALTNRRFSNALELSVGDGQPYHTLLANQSIGEVVGNEVLDLTPLLGTSRVYRLRFRAHNSTETTVTVLPAINVNAVVDLATVPQPSFMVVAYAGAGAALLFLVVSAAGWRRRDALVVCLAATLPVVLITRLAAELLVRRVGSDSNRADDLFAVLRFEPRGAPIELAGVDAARVGFVALLVAGAVLAMRHSGQRAFRRLAWAPTACLLVGLIATDARWSELMAHRYDYLVPDAWGYQSIAANFPRKMASYRPASPDREPGPLWSAGYDGTANPLAVFYAGGNNGREPGWPAALRLVFNVLGVSGFHTRLVSLGFGVLAAILTCALGWRALHPAVGVAGGVLYALNVGTVSNSVLGLREEIVTVVLLCLVWSLFIAARRGAPRARRLALVGTSAGALVLIRADMLVLATELIVAATLVLRWPWRLSVVALATMGVIAGPMYAGFAATHRDPFYPGTYGATVNRNLEFPERHGTPGFPTSAEYAANWSSGPTISPTTYFFGYHTVPQFISYALRGVPRVFHEFVYRNQPWRLALFVTGVALLAVQRRWLVPFMLMVALVPFYSFMAGAPGPMFVPRYAHHALPYAELASAYALCAVPLVVWWTVRGQYQMPTWGRPSAAKNLSST